MIGPVAYLIYQEPTLVSQFATLQVMKVLHL